MSKKTTGMLIGAGAGLALVWLFRDRLTALFDVRALIIVKTGDDNRPHVDFVTDEVTVRRNRNVRWSVDNRSDADVVIALADWENENHEPVAPAVDPDPDDHDHPPQKGLTREVPAGKRLPIRGRARAPHGPSRDEKVKYAVYLGKDLEIDPIVKLTP
jgi:hypothetical protein